MDRPLVGVGGMDSVSATSLSVLQRGLRRLSLDPRAVDVKLALSQDERKLCFEFSIVLPQTAQARSAEFSPPLNWRLVAQWAARNHSFFNDLERVCELEIDA